MEPELMKLAEKWDELIEQETKDYLVTQIGDWAEGAWCVCMRLEMWDARDRFDQVSRYAKQRIKEINDAEQDTDALVGR